MQDKVEQLKDTAKNQAGAAAQKAGWSEASAGDDHVAPPDDQSPESYVDPQDLQFATAAAGRERSSTTASHRACPPPTGSTITTRGGIAPFPAALGRRNSGKGNS